ncbi:MAG: hypothetical protein ACE37E_01085 [Hyphomicrobiales bacterium]
MSTDEVSFDVTPEEFELARQIARRAAAFAVLAGIDGDASSLLQTLWTDLTAVHANGTRLDLQKLLDADDGTLAHDVFGINANIDRETGKLDGFFVPRCALPIEVAA